MTGRRNCHIRLWSLVFLVFQASVLHYKILEVILIKAIVRLHVRHRVHLQPRADVFSVVTVSSVCKEWCWIINGSRRSRMKIKKIVQKARVRLLLDWILYRGACTTNVISTDASCYMNPFINTDLSEFIKVKQFKLWHLSEEDNEARFISDLDIYDLCDLHRGTKFTLVAPTLSFEFKVDLLDSHWDNIC